MDCYEEEERRKTYIQLLGGSLDVQQLNPMLCSGADGGCHREKEHAEDNGAEEQCRKEFIAGQPLRAKIYFHKYLVVLLSYYLDGSSRLRAMIKCSH